MNFLEIANTRQSCRSYEEGRAVEREKLDAVLEAVRLAPSACNGQPYHLTVCQGSLAKEVAAATMGMGMNKFAPQAPVLIVISEMPYNKTAAMGAKVKGNDYRSIDIGIATAYLTAEAAAQGLSTCILGWLDDKRSGSFAIWSIPSGWSSPWAMPKREILSEIKKERNFPNWFRKWNDHEYPGFERKPQG